MTPIPHRLSPSQAIYVRIAIETFIAQFHVPPFRQATAEALERALREGTAQHSAAFPMGSNGMTSITLSLEDGVRHIHVIKFYVHRNEQMTDLLMNVISGMLAQHTEQYAEGLIQAAEFALDWISELTLPEIWTQRNIQTLQQQHNTTQKPTNDALRAGRNAAYAAFADHCEVSRPLTDHVLIKAFFRIVTAMTLALEPPEKYQWDQFFSELSS